MAKVSIVIPTYNVEPYLRECMESITRQTLEDIEIICINDGSTDGSLAILKEYEAKDNRIKLVDKENGGYGVGMNIGFGMATGEYIGILEPDDFVPLNMYEDLYNVAKANDLDLVKADFYRFMRDEDGSMRMYYNALSKNPDDYNVVFNPSENPETIRYKMNTWSGIYKREFIEANHIRHNETPGASFQDNGFFFQTFIFAKRAMIIDRPYYCNRRDNPNSSVKDPQKVYCMNVEYDYIRDILMDNEELWDRFKYAYTVRKFHNYNNTLKRISEEYKLPYIERISEEFNRAIVKGEMREEDFTEREWEKIQLLIKSPKAYYNTYAIGGAGNVQIMRKLRKAQKTVRKLRKELNLTKVKLSKVKKQLAGIKKSKSYKIGRAITYIPRHLKK